MINKNRYLYYSILPCLLLLITIGVYVSGYNPPTQNPPFGNLPAPINAGPNSQTKEGDLTVEGNLTTGSFKMAAGAGANKVLTTDASGIATWQEAAGGWDGVLPSYTTTQRNDLSLVDGLVVFNTTDDAMQIYVSGVWRNVGGKLSLGILCSLDGDCDSTHCIDGVCCDTTCSGSVCQTCGALSSAGLGNCGYVNSSSNDPRSTCTTASPGAADSCKSPNCNGTGYACGYLSGEASQPTCKTCTGSSYNPANIAIGSQDAQGTNLCTATHYRCDGAGACTAPYTTACKVTTPTVYKSCTPSCPSFGYELTLKCDCTYTNCTRAGSCSDECKSCLCGNYVY